MATSKIEIFKTVLTPDRNAMVDKLDNYLATCTLGYINYDFQYQKMDSVIQVRIETGQANFQNRTIGNYARITQEGKSWYFFVTSVKWLSVVSCSVTLVLDTINTFKADFKWSAKTNVIRQHKNRFKLGERTTELEPQFFLLPGPGTYKRTYRQEVPEVIGAANVTLRISAPAVSHAKLKSYTVDTINGIIEYNVEYTPQSSAVTMLKAFVDYRFAERVIDKTPEGLTPVLYGEDKETLYDKNDKDSWYAVYDTNTDKGTVKTYLCKDSPFKAELQAEGSEGLGITPNSMVKGDYYVVDALDLDNNFQEVVVSNAGAPGGLKTNFQDSFWVRDRQCLIFYTEDGVNIQVGEYNYSKYGSGDWQVNEPARFTFTTTKLELKCNKTFVIYDYGSVVPRIQEGIAILRGKSTTTLTPATKIETISAFEDIDRTKSTLIKVIKLPYSPVSYSIGSDGVYRFGQTLWLEQASGLANNLIKVPQDIVFKSRLDLKAENPLLEAHKHVQLDVNIQKTRDIANESKLYNSDFYKPRVVYDSFGFDFNLESVSDDINPKRNLQVDFTPSRLYSSTFMLEYPEYITDERDVQDYNNIQICKRNNEIPIYSSDYVNYIRNGYNYDVKAKNLQHIGTWLGAGVSLGTGALGLGGSIRAGRAAKKAATLNYAGGGLFGNDYQVKGINPLSGLTSIAAASFAGSTATTVTNAIISTINAENSLQQKIDALKATSTNVSTCDDIDLLTAYSGNKAKLKLYKASKKVRHDLFDLFHYTGYKAEDLQLPDLDSRYWFNFVQCEPEFINTGAEIYNDYLDDIKARFEVGVTVYHNRGNGYDWDQQRENWETEIVDHPLTYPTILKEGVTKFSDIYIKGSLKDDVIGDTTYINDRDGVVNSLVWIESPEDYRIHVPALSVNNATLEVYMYSGNISIDGIYYGKWVSWHNQSSDETEPGFHESRVLLTQSMTLIN